MREFYNGSSGASFLELVLVLPVVILIVLSGIELGNCLRIFSKQSALVREIGDSAFRQCATSYGYGALDNPATLTVDESSTVLAQLTSCLQAVLANTSNWVAADFGAANGGSPHSTILTVVKWDSSQSLGSEPRIIAQVADNTIVGSRMFGQHLSLPDHAPEFSTPFRNQLLKDHEVMVYCEFGLNYSPLVPFVARLFNFNGRTFYATSVF